VENLGGRQNTEKGSGALGKRMQGTQVRLRLMLLGKQFDSTGGRAIREDIENREFIRWLHQEIIDRKKLPLKSKDVGVGNMKTRAGAYSESWRTASSSSQQSRVTSVLQWR